MDVFGTQSRLGTRAVQNLENTLTIEGPGDTLLEYSFVTEGQIEYGVEGDADDTITERLDGFWQVDGVVGGADDYMFEGQLLAWEGNLNPSEYDVFVNGGPVDVSSLPTPGELVPGGAENHITIHGPSDGFMTYHFVAEGQIYFGLFGDVDDAVMGREDGMWEALGAVSGIDDYGYNGEIVAWRATRPPEDYTIIINGEETDLSHLPEPGDDEPIEFLEPSIEGCSVGMDEVQEDNPLVLSVTVRNNNVENPIVFDIVWRAIDVEGQPEVARIDGAGVGIESRTETFDASFIPESVGIAPQTTTRIEVSVEDVGILLPGEPSASSITESFMIG